MCACNAWLLQAIEVHSGACLTGQRARVVMCWSLALVKPATLLLSACTLANSVH
jgi:hypothetical protein